MRYDPPRPVPSDCIVPANPSEPNADDERVLVEKINQYRSLFKRKGELLLASRACLIEAGDLDTRIIPLKEEIDKLMVRDVRTEPPKTTGA